MAQRKRYLKSKTANILRKAIVDGRFDAQLWGQSIADGNDAPRWRESFWWKGVGGESQWICDLYDAAYSRAFSKEVSLLWSGKSLKSYREANAVVERNRVIRTESNLERELRLLRENLSRLPSA